mgnify:CR=1 FL=1
MKTGEPLIVDDIAWFYRRPTLKYMYTHVLQNIKLQNDSQEKNNTPYDLRSYENFHGHEKYYFVFVIEFFTCNCE